MKLSRKAGATSEIWQIFIADSSSTVGAGLAGLVFNSAGLTAYYHANTDATATAISLATMTLGAFSSGGFKEIDATNMKGWYAFCPPNAAIADQNGIKSCAIHLQGATNMAPLPIEVDLKSQVDVTHWNTTAVATPATAGVAEVNVKNINNVSASSVTTVNANQGTTQPINFTGTGASALAKSDMVDIAGAAVSTSTAQIGVNAVQAGGTAWGSGAITAASIATDAITAAKIAADAIGASELAADAATEIATAVWALATRTLTANTNLGFPSNFSALLISAGGVMSADAVAISGDATAADNLEAMLDGTGGVTLSLKKIDINASTGPGISIVTVDESAIVIVGGLYGIDCEGQSGGANFVALSGNSPGIMIQGAGTKAGILSTGGATGAGVEFVGGGTSGSGMVARAPAGNSDGITAMKAGTGKDINGTLLAVTTLTTYTGNTLQTGDSFARIGSSGAGLTALGDTRLTNLDATVSSRMATFTLPANFSAFSIDTSGRIVTTYAMHKNTAFTDFPFVITDSTNHAPATGKTVTATRRIGSGTFAACANSPTEVSSGAYTIDLAAADLNGNVVTLRFAATGCDDTFVTLILQT